MDALEANLSGLAPDLRVSLRTHVESFVNRMLEDRTKAARETRLTWDQRKVRNRKPLGTEGLDLLREHVSIARGTYFIQNCKLYGGNGARITFDDVDLNLRSKVRESFENFMAQAVKSDPGLCKHCLAKFESFTTDNHEEYAEHLLLVHPEVLALKLSQTQPKVSHETFTPPMPVVRIEERPQPVEARPVVEWGSGSVERGPATIPVAESNARVLPKDMVPGEYVCGLCGYLAKTERSLRIHSGHKHRNG